MSAAVGGLATGAEVELGLAGRALGGELATTAGFGELSSATKTRVCKGPSF